MGQIQQLFSPHGAYGDFLPSHEQGGVRWGHVNEIDRRTHVGTPAWYQIHQQTRLRHLSAWRRLHMQRPHETISRRAAQMGVSPSSDTSVPQKVKMVQEFEAADAARSKKTGRKGRRK